MVGAPTVHQGYLENVVKTLFKGENILYDVRKNANLKDPETGYFLELDIWIPKLNISFEFQDPYHYTAVWDSQKTLAQIQQKDSVKQDLAAQHGETLILVPCWWDGSVESLISTIRSQRPDLLEKQPITSAPIPLIPPADYFSGDVIPGIGELMLASFPTSQLPPVSEESPWWLGEKYDGVRVCWSAMKQMLFTRSGLSLLLEPNFYKSLSAQDVSIDGEMWLGRGHFSDSQQLIKFEYDPNWQYARIVAFDEPGKSLRNEPFEARYKKLLANVPSQHPIIITAARKMCYSQQELNKASQSILKDEGEGVILRKPGSAYERGRSDSLLKLKASRVDREALVVEVLDVNSFLLKLPDETLIVATASGMPFNTKIKRGDVATFAYDSYSSRALPIDPRIYRIRTDITWDDVVRDYMENSTKMHELNEPSQKFLGMDVKPSGYWNTENGKNRRVFFEKLAFSLNLDPFSADTWYSLSQQTVLQYPGGSSVLASFKNSYSRAVTELFPELKLDPKNFHFLPLNYWKNVKHRRQLLLQFAHTTKFDPFVAENWYSITTNSVHAFKGGSTLLSLYGGSLGTALDHLFPEIVLDKNKFTNIPRSYWDDEQNQRRFFLSIADKLGFNPFVPENWYSFSPETIRTTEGLNSLLSSRFNGSFVSALVHLFPDLKLNPTKFAFLPQNYWKNASNQRKFLLDFAKRHGFDPLVSENWYKVTAVSLLASKGGSSILAYYKRDIGSAVAQLFPELQIDASRFLAANTQNCENDVPLKKSNFITEPLIEENHQNDTSNVMEFAHVPRFDPLLRNSSNISGNFWKDPNNQRNFFINFASAQGFDPLVSNNWYGVTSDTVQSFKWARSVLLYYKGSTIKALMHLFPEIGLESNKFLYMKV